jgi:hypothetical protein
MISLLMINYLLLLPEVPTTPEKWYIVLEVLGSSLKACE